VSRRKLLLADDSITIQKVVNLTFADEGIDVVTVGDGAAALAHLSSETPDILLADVNMPGPTGYEICEQLRANEATRGVPVILLVGSFEPFDEAEASRVGANAYLTKPFQSIKQLIAQVNDLMDTAPRVDPDAVTEVPNAVVPAQAPVIEEPTIGEEPAAASPQPETAATESRVFDDLGYQVHAPAAESSAPAAPAADDIENLYERSLSGDSGEDLSDVGIDDEMIETSYSAAEANNDLAAFAAESAQAVETVESPVEPVPSESEIEAAPEAAAPEPPSTETEFGFRSGYDQRFPEDPSKFENTMSYENWQPADMRDGGSATLAPLDTAPLHPIEAAAPPATVGEDTIRMENRFDTTGAAFKFDDVDLLDLSAGEQTPVEITSPANAVEQGGNKQVVTISPELIEMIAQRVVEKLSEKY